MVSIGLGQTGVDRVAFGRSWIGMLRTGVCWRGQVSDALDSFELVGRVWIGLVYSGLDCFELMSIGIGLVWSGLAPIWLVGIDFALLRIGMNWHGSDSRGLVRAGFQRLGQV